jgi:8-oxo-dGTP diphosphatase
MIRVTCAIIRNEDNEVLIVQRGEKSDHPFKWEFPGGKIEEGESEEESIIREVGEELALDIVIREKMEVVEYDYGKKLVRLIPFICDTLEDVPLLSEHMAYKWILPADLASVDFSEADITVAYRYIERTGESSTGLKTGSPDRNEFDDDRELQGLVSRMMGMKEAEWIAVSAVENPAIFRKLIDFSFLPDRKLSFRASWTLTKACNRFPEMIYPYMKRLLEGLRTIENESTRRSFLRIISLSEISKLSQKEHGILADHCFKALNSQFSSVAVKAYSMEILYKLTRVYPELAHELSATINILQGEGSGGIIARGKIILRKLASEPEDHGSSQPLS